jgi:type I restriction enzyme S subunit
VHEDFFKFQLGNCRFSDGDIVFARKGRIGLPRFLPPLEKYTFSHTVFIVKPLSGVLPMYLLWALKREAAVSWLTKEMNQNTGVPTLGKDKTERLPVGLPPIAEQHRIVAKVDELMAICDQLEAQIMEKEQDSRRFLESVLADALAPGMNLSAEAQGA